MEPESGLWLGPAAADVGSKLRLRVLENPVNDVLRVMIEGVAGQLLDVQLIDLSGHLVKSRVVELTEDTDGQQFDLRKQRVGLLLLRFSSGTQSRTVIIVKQ